MNGNIREWSYFRSIIEVDETLIKSTPSLQSSQRFYNQVMLARGQNWRKEIKVTVLFSHRGAQCPQKHCCVPLGNPIPQNQEDLCRGRGRRKDNTEDNEGKNGDKNNKNDNTNNNKNH